MQKEVWNPKAFILTRHHTASEKPFDCTVCEKKFGRRIHLAGHLKTYSEEKPFECAVCEKKFGRRSYLLSHKKLTHHRRLLNLCFAFKHP